MMKSTPARKSSSNADLAKVLQYRALTAVLAFSMGYLEKCNMDGNLNTKVMYIKMKMAMIINISTASKIYTTVGSCPASATEFFNMKNGVNANGIKATNSNSERYI